MRNWSKSREGGGFKGRMRPSWGAGTGEQYWMAAILVWCARCFGAMLDSHHLGVVCPYTAEALPHTHSFAAVCPHVAGQQRTDTILVWCGMPHAAGQCWIAAILAWSAHTLQGSSGEPPFCCGASLRCRAVQDGSHFGAEWCAHMLWGSTRWTPFWCGVEQCAHTPAGPMQYTRCRTCFWECIIITSAVE